MSIRFGVIGMNHPHIYGQVNVLLAAGAKLVNYYAAEADFMAEFAKRYPQGKAARSAEEILEDDSLHLITSAAIPDERAALGIRVMQHGKDYLVDKPGLTTLAQLEAVRRVQADTKRIYSVYFSEHLGNPASIRAGELVEAGAIGQVVAVLGTGPHRIGNARRDDWFYQPERSGGILNFLASHQFEQFLFFTGSPSAEIVAAQVANFHQPQYPDFEDYGDVLLRSDRATGYFRVDWLTPTGLPSWGDVRLFLTGTDGTIEIRKNLDLAGKPGDNHLFLVDKEEVRYLDCARTPLPFGQNLVNDVLNRTETAMSQALCLYASELAIRAQMMAKENQK